MSRRAAWLTLAMLLVATPLSACTVSTTAVAFGSYHVFDALPLDSTGSVSVLCTTPYTIAIGSSSGNAAFVPRQLASGADRLDYNLYTDASYSVVWGDGSGGTATVSGTVDADYTIYGRIPAGQNATVGSYADVVVVTLTF